MVRIGRVSLAVIIPKDWTRGMEIEAGDRVGLTYNGAVEIRKLEEAGP